jgi:5-methylcytosine-specific restriction endonuclease McrA
MKRKTPSSFVCRGCGATVTRRPPPARDNRTAYCSLRCKMRVFTDKQNIARTAICQQCGVTFTGYGKQYCSDACRQQRLSQAFQARPRMLKSCVCLVCSSTFTQQPSGSKKLCSVACRHYFVGQSNLGKRHKPHPPRIARSCVCPDCGRPSTTKHWKPSRCLKCRRLAERTGDGCYRAKLRGRPRDYSITAVRVGQRDRWRCQLCGCATPKRLRGTCKPNAPEIDHIIPIGAGGGHTWDNVQCACRSCNIKKGSKPLGQVRLLA